MADNSSPSSGNGSERVFGDKVEVKDRVKREMLKPLVFGNHQKKFKLFSFAVSAGGLFFIFFFLVFFCCTE